ncbi:septation protein SepH [Gordonia shandongensis]|uniref:septation protein SepH n=1 Tax=Gordonia shandongensis TaxID=376351 RepID=UPI00041D499D|nr:septation protein SepH [Gordonia shandongensis]
MRELHADRADDEGAHVVVVDLESGDEFQIPIDATLRALVHPPEPVADDVTPVREPAHAVADEQSAAATLSPREIQARIRAGATVDELADATGVSVERINRFAHPVLLERSRAAELARASHPTGVDGPALGTLGELVAECLVLRGGSPAEAAWDAWRTEDGQWIVRVSPSGDDVYAHWRFTPGSHGGTTDPMDDLAFELTEPELARSARPSISSVPDPPAPPTREVDADGHEYVTVNADDLTDRQRRDRDRDGFGDVLDLRYDDERPVEPDSDPDRPAPRHRGKRAKPAVPAWEDVLLGVRSHPNE